MVRHKGEGASAIMFFARDMKRSKILSFSFYTDRKIHFRLQDHLRSSFEIHKLPDPKLDQDLSSKFVDCECLDIRVSEC